MARFNGDETTNCMLYLSKKLYLSNVLRNSIASSLPFYFRFFWFFIFICVIFLTVVTCAIDTKFTENSIFFSKINSTKNKRKTVKSPLGDNGASLILGSKPFHQKVGVIHVFKVLTDALYSDCACLTQ